MKHVGVSTYFASQSPELSIGCERLPGLRLSYFEGGSFDARNSNQISEDFIAYQYKDNVFCFVVCDGVGQSEDAGFAANLFGKNILPTLFKAAGNKEYIEGVSSKLRTIISAEIDKTPLRADNPRFHQRARKEIGAQVKFTCGVIDFNRKVLEIYWAGDVRFVVYDQKSNIINFWEDDNRQFWSTKSDYALNLDYYSVNIDFISKASITSDGIRDGFKKILDKEIYLNNGELASQLYKLGVDDVSGIDVDIFADDAPNFFSSLKDVKIKDRTLSWIPISGSEKYRIYYVNNSEVVNTFDIDAKQGSYLIQDNFDAGNVFVQAISSNIISSDLFKPIIVPAVDVDVTSLRSQSFSKAPKPTDTLEPIVIPVIETDRTLVAFPSRPQPSPKTKEVHPKPIWMYFAVPIMIMCLATLTLFLYYPIMNLLSLVPSPTPISSPSSTAIVTSTNTVVVQSVTITTVPSLTFVVENGTDVSILSTETPVPLMDISVLDKCQREKYLIDPLKYQSSFYKIQYQDTLFAISRDNNLSVKDIMEANCLTNDVINTGKYLILPIGP